MGRASMGRGLIPPYSFVIRIEDKNLLLAKKLESL